MKIKTCMKWNFKYFIRLTINRHLAHMQLSHMLKVEIISATNVCNFKFEISICTVIKYKISQLLSKQILVK